MHLCLHGSGRERSRLLIDTTDRAIRTFHRKSNTQPHIPHAQRTPSVTTLTAGSILNDLPLGLSAGFLDEHVPVYVSQVAVPP